MGQASRQLLAQPAMQTLVSALLSHGSPPVRQTALRVLASQTSGITNDSWLPPLEKALAEAGTGDLPLLIDAVRKLKTSRFDDKLQAIADDAKRPLAIALEGARFA